MLPAGARAQGRRQLGGLHQGGQRLRLVRGRGGREDVAVHVGAFDAGDEGFQLPALGHGRGCGGDEGQVGLAWARQGHGYAGFGVAPAAALGWDPAGGGEAGLQVYGVRARARPLAPGNGWASVIGLVLLGVNADGYEESPRSRLPGALVWPGALLPLRRRRRQICGGKVAAVLARCAGQRPAAFSSEPAARAGAPSGRRCARGGGFCARAVRGLGAFGVFRRELCPRRRRRRFGRGVVRWRAGRRHLRTLRRFSPKRVYMSS